MSLNDVEVALSYGALDSTAAVDGGFKHSHVLRALTRGVNNLLVKEQELLNLLFDARPANDGTPEGTNILYEKAIRVVGTLTWTRMLPGRWMRPKMPGIKKADVYFRASIPTGQVINIQLEVMRQSLDFSTSAGRQGSFTGTGALTTYWIRNADIDPGGYERFGFWIRGQPTTTPGDVSLHTTGGAGLNRGTIDSVQLDGHFLAVQPDPSTGNSLAWIFSNNGNTWGPANYLLVHDGPNVATIGNPIYQGQIIACDGINGLMCWPPPANAYVADSMRGKFFQIYQLPTMRCTSLGVFQNRGP